MQYKTQAWQDSNLSVLLHKTLRSTCSLALSTVSSSQLDPKYVTNEEFCNMVCAKCQKLQKTSLATPGVKRKNDMYYGSPTAGGGDKSKSSATQGPTGIGKVGATAFHMRFIRLTYTCRAEQASQQKCKESLRRLRELMQHMQNQDRRGAKVLPTLCLQG